MTMYVSGLTRTQVRCPDCHGTFHSTPCHVLGSTELIHSTRLARSRNLAFWLTPEEKMNTHASLRFVVQTRNHVAIFCTRNDTVPGVHTKKRLRS